MAQRFWLLKSDPQTFGWDDLERAPRETTCWDGVRNYQARNYLRDEVTVGDGVLFYHSQLEKAVVGIARVSKAGHPDPTQFDRKHDGYDSAATREEPVWFAIDVTAATRFPTPVTLDAMRREKGLAEMVLLKKGSRLSVQPVTANEWKIVTKLGQSK